jgi:radical SAM protein with 4Fe4S-binding SPASM domain
VGRRLAELKETYNGFLSDTFTSWHQLLASPPPIACQPGAIHVCGAAQESCAIDADGSVLACNAAPDYICGNIRDQDLLEIWHHSPEMQAVRALSRLSVDDVEGCNRCDYRFACTAGCRADAWSMTGSWTGSPSSICWQRESLQ